MDYTDVVATFLRPRPDGTALPAVVVEGGPARRLRDACEPVAMHAVWNRTTNERLGQAAAAGLDAVEMNILTELWIGMPLLSYTATRGWPPAAMQRALERLQSRRWVQDGNLTDTGRAARQSIEQRTDDQEQPIVTALGDHLEPVCDRLNHWSQLCIKAGTFPPDPLKRAAG